MTARVFNCVGCVPVPRRPRQLCHSRLVSGQSPVKQRKQTLRVGLGPIFSSIPILLLSWSSKNGPCAFRQESVVSSRTSLLPPCITKLSKMSVGNVTVHRGQVSTRPPFHDPCSCLWDPAPANLPKRFAKGAGHGLGWNGPLSVKGACISGR